MDVLLRKDEHGRGARTFTRVEEKTAAANRIAAAYRGRTARAGADAGEDEAEVTEALDVLLREDDSPLRGPRTFTRVEEKTAAAKRIAAMYRARGTRRGDEAGDAEVTEVRRGEVWANAVSSHIVATPLQRKPFVPFIARRASLVAPLD